MTSPNSFYKQRASDDYRASMREFGGRLASSGSELLRARQDEGPFQFDVAIIGSGYGGAVCAARLAAKLGRPDRICVIERGQEWVPGTFPDTVESASQQTRFDLVSQRKNKLNNPIGLMNSAKFDEVSILAGSGLGGGSLINANVAVRPDSDVFQTGDWPQELTDPAVLSPYYDRAAAELGIATEELDQTPKMRLNRQSMERMAGASFAPADLAIARGSSGNLPIYNAQGMRQRACIDCGDCCSGCNVGAKNSLNLNYLPLARRLGARMFTQCEVDQLEKEAGGYRIQLRHYHDGRTNRQPYIRGSVTAQIVIIAAGSLGSTEILLRSQSPSLRFSSHLGSHWSGNGDMLAFIRDIPQLTNIGGRGAYPSREPPVGPTIQSNVTFPSRPNVRDRLLLQEGAIARAYANVVGLVVRDLNFDHTMVILAMGHDGSQGRITLDENGHALIKWPGMLDSEYRRRVQQEFSRLATAFRGNYRALRAFGDNLVTVHPLGGCKLGDHPDNGVVNHWGQVFDPEHLAQSGGSAIHDGLYVADGSIIPSSLGANPFLTISALSERIAERISVEPKYADLKR
ncbi:MAG: GMC family oxidoreductase N-terminal domain-containing protein [Pirellulaceae bacterium]